MAGIEKGDRVIATEAVPLGFLSTVDKGTQGVVVDVDSPLFGSTTYSVHWENGDTSEVVEERRIAKLAAEASSDGCAPLLLAFGLLSIAAASRTGARRHD